MTAHREPAAEFLEDDSESFTTSTFFEEKIKLDFKADGAGPYLVLVHMQFRSDSDAIPAEAQLLEDGNEICINRAASTVSLDCWTPFMYVGMRDYLPGGHTLGLKYRITNGSTARCRYAKIAVVKISWPP